MHYKLKVKIQRGHYYKDAKGSIFKVYGCDNKMGCYSESCKGNCLELMYHSDGRKADLGYALCIDSYKASTLVAELTPEELAFYAF